MADTKISDLADGTTPDTADVFPAARAGANVKLSWAELIAAASVPPASALATHEADTTNIHGITNTAVLETTTGAQSKADAAQAASQPVDSDLTAIAALTTTVYGRALLALADAAAARTALALGTAATSATGDFDAAGAASAAQAASQPLDSDLTAFAGLAIAADKLPYGTGSHTLGLADFTAAGRALVDDADAAAQRTTLGLVIGTNVQAQDAELAALAGLTSAADKLPYFTGSGTAALADLTTAARTVLDDTTVGAMRTTLGIPTAVGGVEWTVVTKAADESVSSSASLQNDDELFFTAASGGLYAVEIDLLYGSPAGAGTPDIKVALGEDTTLRGAFHSVCFGTADTLRSVGYLAANNSAEVAGTSATNRGWMWRGTYVGAGGTFRVLWAQNTSDGNATIMRTGSLLRYRRIV